MKHFLLIFLTIVSIKSVAQEWVEYKADSVLTVSIPDNFELSGTDDYQVATAAIDNGLIMITSFLVKAEDRPHDEKELVNSYHAFKRGFITTQKGKLLNDELVEIQGLQCLQFSMSTTVDGERQIRHCLIV